MAGIAALLCKWWALGAAVVLCAGAVALLVSRLFGARRDNKKEMNSK